MSAAWKTALAPRRLACHGQTGSDEWYTPPALIAALGPFDLDPACGMLCPNRTARRRYATRGLDRPWAGRVWLNPPFSDVRPWIERMIDHAERDPAGGILLVFARSDAVWFQRAVHAAGGLYMLRGRTHFSRPAGNSSRCPLGCALIPFGRENRDAVLQSNIPGLWLSILVDP